MAQGLGVKEGGDIHSNTKNASKGVWDRYQVAGSVWLCVTSLISPTCMYYLDPSINFTSCGPPTHCYARDHYQRYDNTDAMTTPLLPCVPTRPLPHWTFASCSIYGLFNTGHM